MSEIKGWKWSLVNEGKNGRATGRTEDGRFVVELTGVGPDGWCAFLYRDNETVPVLALTMPGPSAIPLQRGMMLAVKRMQGISDDE